MKPHLMLRPYLPALRHVAAFGLVVLSVACSSTKETEAPADKTPKAVAKAAPKSSPPPAAPLGKAEQELASGITSYENGAYKPAARQLQNALSLGLDAPGDQAQAHKYLAFMHCVSKREKQCREEFVKAREADPRFDLTPAEAGHPIWGPVFRKLKTTGKTTQK